MSVAYDRMSAPWLGNGGVKILNLSRSSWSLAVIADCLTRLGGRNSTFAFPDYMCNSSLWPLRRYGAKVHFYPIDPITLQPDYRMCDELPRIDAFVLVHYFGKPADASRAEKWARSRGALLIEDAAHVLRPIKGVGEHGDFVIYSPRKLLSIPDGAFLVVRTPSIGLASEIAVSVSKLGQRAPPTFLWKLRHSRLAHLFPERAHEAENFSSDEQVIPMARTPKMSRLAGAIIAKTDLASIAKKRQQNAQAVLAAVAALSGWTPVFFPESDWVAHRLPMRCENAETAQRYFGQLRKAGLVAETWPTLAPDVPTFSSARRLRQTVLLLPCHQHLNTASLGAL